MKLVRESIEDLLVPKSQEEINKALDQWSIEEKIDMIESRIDADELFNFMNKGGANKIEMIEILLEEATEKELKEIILEIADDDSDLETVLYFTTGGGGRIEEEKIKKAFRKFIDSTNENELSEIIDNMIMQNPVLISRPNGRQGWHFG